ncbi:MAG: 1-acyl-sn-glycerol-3-phosphate acyltransferase [Sedimentisphaerales bacterium]|nr:1-acyl-sn-glycerol-3-phosphate acyltransferase [Sedimentisphaerales bacterium]
MRFWYRLNQWGAQVMYSTFFHLRVFGREHVPQDGPVLFVSNHQSFLDPVLCGVSLGRELDYIARDSLFNKGLFDKYIRSLNAFPIQRDQADLAAIRVIIDRLKQGRAIVLFPEATRTRDGKIKTIKSGFELIARKSGAPTVPVVIDGAFETWPRTQALPGIGNIRVRYGEPIAAAEAKAMAREDFVAEINQRLRQMQNELRVQFGRLPFEY